MADTTDKEYQEPGGFFRLRDGEINIDVADRTYGVVCGCGASTFTEDLELTTIRCSRCQQILATRLQPKERMH